MKNLLKDNIFNAIHKDFSICGWCGNRNCKHPKSHYILPAEIDTIVNIIFEQIDNTI